MQNSLKRNTSENFKLTRNTGKEKPACLSTSGTVFLSHYFWLLYSKKMLKSIMSRRRGKLPRITTFFLACRDAMRQVAAPLFPGCAVVYFPLIQPNLLEENPTRL